MNINFESERFYIVDDQQELVGEITYKQDGQLLLANHTYVNPSYRGQNIAGQLLEKLVEFAREQGFQIKALCSYVVHKFETDSQFDDVNVEKD